ncbi:MAG: family 16 glycosylhydrolase, partial [Clostridium perfringens]|nr:family 16 glycosylhydrolase [Clostridium perfringens]
MIISTKLNNGESIEMEVGALSETVLTSIENTMKLQGYAGPIYGFIVEGLEDLTSNTIEISATLENYSSEFLSQNVKVYSYDETANTFNCLGVTNVDDSANVSFNINKCGVFFIALLDAPIYDENAVTVSFSDDFDYEGAPNSDNWGYDIGNNDGWGNEEQEYYTDSPDNVIVENNTLVITAREQAYGGCNYTSARLKSLRSWTYGKFEISAKLPKGQGLWPAIWMLPTDNVYGSWPNSGEIDIMECTGSSQNYIHGSLQTQAQNFKSLAGDQTEQIEILDDYDSFHTYGLIWTPEYIEILVDGIEYFRSERNLSEPLNTEEYPFVQEFHLMLNIAVGGSMGGNIDNSVFPQSMIINSINVYDLGLENFSLNSNPVSTYALGTSNSSVILQSEFENLNVIGWTSYVDTQYAEADVIFNTETKTMDGIIDNAGGKNWEIQLYHPKITLEAGEEYSYSVTLESTIDRELYVGIQSKSVGRPYFLNTKEVTANEVTTISGTYTQNETKSDISIIVYMGSGQGT